MSFIGDRIRDEWYVRCAVWDVRCVMCDARRAVCIQMYDNELRDKRYAMRGVSNVRYVQCAICNVRCAIFDV